MERGDDQTVKSNDSRGVLKGNSSSKGRMAPTAQQLSSQWMTEAEKETESDRLIRKSKQSPFIPIGE